MTFVLLDSIIEGTRARREYHNLDRLADSIRELGVLSPIALTPDFHLVCGGRRVRAARMAGLERIPAVIVTGMDDALRRLKAERDENVCREEMTPSELVALGLEIERLERPKAAERQGQPGAAARWGNAFGSAELNASPEPSTRAKVADALGISEPTYTRMKHVVQIANGTINAPDEVREVAKQELDGLNAGTITASAAYNKVREAVKPKPEPEPNNLAMPQPRKYGPRAKPKQIISNAIDSLTGSCIALDEIQDLNNTITNEEAERLASDLSKIIRSLKRIHALLKKES